MPQTFSQLKAFITAGIVGLLPGQMIQAQTTANPSHPNIIFILTDDMGYGDPGCYGQQTLKTPNIDRMAAEGIRFTQFYAGSPVCAPSRASLMTGRDPGHCRVRGNYETGPNGFGGELELRPQDMTIAEVLKRAGYQTTLIGKWGLGMNGTTGEPDRKGFDTYYGYLNQAHAHMQFPDYLFRDGRKEMITENADGRRGRYSNDIFTSEAIQYIRKAGTKPFFLYLAFVTPHAEMLVPEDSIWDQFKGRFKETPFVMGTEGGNGIDSLGVYHSQAYPEAAFASVITHIDNDVNKILATLKELGLDENTVVMFSSDNGPHKEGGNNPYYFNSNGEYRGIKRDVYEGGIRIPFIVKWPAMIRAGQVSMQIGAFWDILPTVAEMAGVNINDVPGEGYSLMPTLTGDTASQRQHPYYYWEFHENKYSDQAVRKGDWKAVRHDPDRPAELYNLKKDPVENYNVAFDYPDIVKEMERIMGTARVPNKYFPLKRSGGGGE